MLVKPVTKSAASALTAHLKFSLESEPTIIRKFTSSAVCMLVNRCDERYLHHRDAPATTIDIKSKLAPLRSAALLSVLVAQKHPKRTYDIWKSK